MFENLGWWEIACLVLLALFIFGPERLPTIVRDGVQMLRKLRSMARNATEDFREQLGPDVELEDLHPKRLIRRHLLSEQEEEELRRPFRSAMGDGEYRDLLRQLREDAGLPPAAPNPGAGLPGGGGEVLNRSDPEYSLDTNERFPRGRPVSRLPGDAPKVDPDAT